MGDELAPRFEVELQLDGDDDAGLQTANARRALQGYLNLMQHLGTIRGYVLTELDPS